MIKIPIPVFSMALPLIFAMPAAYSQDLVSADPINEIVVTSARRGQLESGHVGNISAVSEDRIQGIGHAHIHELLSTLSGVWISRGSGQESLSAIRSPVLTGAGSCGAFLTLEDGIPSRPGGFCNVNQLMELNTEQASAIEVIRGPGNALYGSNAVHGIINVLMSNTDSDSSQYVAGQVGSNDYYRVDTRLGLPFGDKGRGGFVLVDDGGFREESGYRQAKAFLNVSTEALGGELTAAVALSELEQETAGFIFGKDSYKDPALNRQNLNPEAFRDAGSQRLHLKWRRSFKNIDVDIRPYVRRSEMTFLQHFLPGQPLEENGHVSAGALLSATVRHDGRTTVFGFDIEWADVYLRETQFGLTEGSAFLQETRPSGKHYDYDVASLVVSPYVQTRYSLTERLSLVAGLRAEYSHYDYRNRMLDGNSRDDGTACGFGGCLYSRPADRNDDYTNVAPKIGILIRVSEFVSAYANLTRGFRAPQMTELYRLQSGQLVSELNSEEIDSVEFGVRMKQARWQFDGAVFAMRKSNSIFRDAEGFNVNGARSRHDGVEFSLHAQLHTRWRLKLNGSYARHVYDFDAVAQRGETFISGRDVDTAPRWLGNMELRFAASNSADVSLQWTALGRYYLDAENRFTYPGHNLLNLRWYVSATDRLSATVSINNLSDTAIADRADYAFGSYRYFPGRGREAFMRFRYEL